jgi:serine/threonine protein kinase
MRITLPSNEKREQISLTTIKKLGSGSYGIVYKIIFNGKPAALKIVSRRREDGSERTDLKKEIDIIQEIIRKYPNCNEKNLLCYHDISEDENNIYLISELMDSDINDFLYSSSFGKLTVCKKIDLVWNIINQVLDGLESLHQAGIIHRDIKVENVLIKKKGKQTIAKIADFGLSCLKEKCKGVSGTPLYLSPQILFGKRVKWTPREDLYGVGVMIFFMLTNNFFVDDESINDIETQKFDSKQAFAIYKENYKQRLETLDDFELDDCPASTKKKFDKMIQLVKELVNPIPKDIDVYTVRKFLQ